MRVYKKTTMHPYCIYLTEGEMQRLINPDDWFIIGKIREKLDGLNSNDAD